MNVIVIDLSNMWVRDDDEWEVAERLDPVCEADG